MKITFLREGGIAFFPGLHKPTTINDNDMSQDDLDELERLMQESCFFEQPKQVGALARGAADYQHYTITIDDGTQRHSVHLVEPIQDIRLQELVAFLQAKVRETQRQDSKSEDRK